MPSVRVDILGDTGSLQKAYRKAAEESKLFGKHVAKSTTSVHGLTSSVEKGATGMSAFAKSALLAGGALVGVGSLYEGIKKTVSAAEDFNQGQRQLQAQLKANGESFKAVSPWVEKLSASQVQLGFTSTQTEQAFTQLDRASGSAATAYKYMAVTADLAAARHIDLNKAALVVGKVMDGNVGILNRYGVAVAKGTSAADALSQAQQKLQGQAQASTTPFEKFHAVLNNIEVAIGNVLLPTITKYLDKVTEWMSKAENQKKITDTVRTAIHDLGEVMKVVKGIINDLIPVAQAAYAAFQKFADAVGGTKKAIEILGAAIVTWKVASSIANIGSEASGSAKLVSLLARNLKALSLIGPIAIAIAVVVERKQIDKYVSGLLDKYGIPGGTNKGDLSTAAGRSKIAGTFGQGLVTQAQTAQSGTVGTFGPSISQRGSVTSSAAAGIIKSAKTLSTSQLASLWVQAGGDPKLASTMAAIAKAESGGRTNALNTNASTGDYSAGLWQINYLGGMRAPRTAKYGSPEQVMANPLLNAKAAVDLAAGGRGLGNWTTYTSGAYKQYLSGGGGMTGPPGPTTLPDMTPVKSPASIKAAAQAAKNKVADAAAKAAAKIIKDVHDDAVVALEGTPKLGVDVGKLQKAWTALATTIAKPFQALAGKAANQVGYLQQLMGTEVPGRVTDYTTEITAQVNTQVTALEDGLAKLKARGMSGTAAAAKLASQLNTALTSQEGLLQNAVQAARSVYDTAVSKFTTSFGKLAQDIVSQFQAQTAAHISDLGGKFFQGSKTPAEAALSAMQAADTYSSLQDALNQAQESGDQKQIAMAQRALDEYNLSLDAVAERTKADQDYAAAVKTYTDQRATQEQALTDSLNKFGTGVQNGKMSMDGLPALLKTFGITLGTGPGNATGVVALFAKDLKAATTDNGGIISSLSALQQAFDALVGWVNDKTSANISAGAVNIGGGGDAGAAIGGGGGGSGEGPAAGVAGGAAAYYQPVGYYQSGSGNYAKKPMLAGGGFINRSGLAYLHKGETVVPANGSGGNTIEIHVHGSLLSDERKLTDAVLSGLRREKTRLATLGLT